VRNYPAPAFPTYDSFEGMTLLDYFAGQAMQTLLIRHGGGYDGLDDIARSAYIMAEWMLEIRDTAHSDYCEGGEA